MMKKHLLLMITFVLMITFIACGKKGDGNGDTNNSEENIGATEENDPNVSDSNVNEIYFLNYDESTDAVFQDIADVYEAENGIALKVVTPGMATYDTNLQTEISSTEAPVIIEISAAGLQTLGDSLVDLSQTTLYSHLSDQSLSLSQSGNDSSAYGIPYNVEAYGIIVNQAILEKYIDLPDKATGITSIDEITNFNTLKAVVEDMQANKEALGIDGVFASMSFAEGEDTRWTSQLASIPFYYEFRDQDDQTSTIETGQGSGMIEFSYGENLNQIFDLYLNNSVSSPDELSNISENDSIAEFALGQCAMIQHGSWIWSDIQAVPGNTVTEDNLRMLPIYIGAEGEERQGLAVGSHRYLAINKNVDTELQEAGVNFLEWLFTSETGKDIVINQLGFNPPFDTFDDNDQPTDPLKREVNRFLRTDNESTEWTFLAFPGTGFTDALLTGLTGYANGSSDWETLTSNVTDSWAQEYQNQSQSGGGQAGGQGQSGTQSQGGGQSGSQGGQSGSQSNSQGQGTGNQSGGGTGGQSGNQGQGSSGGSTGQGSSGQSSTGGETDNTANTSDNTGSAGNGARNSITLP